MRKNIAIMYGGNSSEFEISRNSAEQVYKNIDKDKFNVYRIMVRGSEWTADGPLFIDIPVNKDDFSILENYIKVKFDCALIIIHGDPGENGILRLILTWLESLIQQVAFFASALTFNKYACKIYLSKKYGH